MNYWLINIDCSEGIKKRVGCGGSSLVASISQMLERAMLAPHTEAYELDDLPVEFVRHILSFMETKDAIRTCVLSRRWRYLWTTVPCLNFNTRSFSGLADFERFVKLVLSHRDETDQWLLNKVVEFATSHCVKEFRINFGGTISDGTSPPIQISSSLFASQSMKEIGFKSCHLANAPASIVGCKSLEFLHLEHSPLHPHQANSSNPFSFIRNKLLGFTELTNLHLNRFTLICPRGTARLDPFADCVNLTDLHLSEICFKSDVNPVDFVISAPRLNKLTLACNHFRCKVVVVAPHLTNLSYIHSSSYVKFEIGLPSFVDFRIGVQEKQVNGLTVDRRKRNEEILHSFINIDVIRQYHIVKTVYLSQPTATVSRKVASLKCENSLLNAWKWDFSVGMRCGISIRDHKRISLDHQYANAF